MLLVGWASRPPFLDGRDAHPTNLCKLFNSRSLVDIDHNSCGTGPPSLFKIGNSCDV